MMLFKISIKNIKKSFSDYAIYFFTLVLGITIFYLFNSIDSQTALLEMNDSKKAIIKLLLAMLSMVSVFVAIILGFLIIYANNFLIKRRKKEFGLYMLLGMGKRDISKILIGETMIIGAVSLIAGLIFGVFGSQLMSILVGKMFEADMSRFTFVFSKAATYKTILYFVFMYILVIIFNTGIISKDKLIDLLNAKKVTEQIKTKNPIISFFVFGISILMLGYAYIQVSLHSFVMQRKDIIIMIVIGCIATFLFYWSLSGFLLQFMKMRKRIYHKNLNMFVMRQLNSQINTNVFSMTVICLLLFITICVLSCGNAMNDAIKKDLRDSAPRDICIIKYFEDDLETMEEDKKEKEFDKRTIKEQLLEEGFDNDNFQEDVVEGKVYTTDELTLELSFQKNEEEVKKQFPQLLWNAKEEIISLSDYNQLAVSYGEDTLELSEGEFVMVCSFQSMKELRDAHLKDTIISIDGKEYKSATSTCKQGYIQMSTSHTNTGVYVLPDSAFYTLENSSLELYSCIFSADYKGETEKEKQEVEKLISKFHGKNIITLTKIKLYETSVGLAVIITFIAIYLGIIFLISGAAVLALKQLSDSADNKERYRMLRKIGAENKMIRKALCQQIGIFFFMPLLLAMIHSIFGIWFSSNFLGGIISSFNLWTVIATTVFLVGIYGIYFLATYLESKRIIGFE